MVARYEKWWWPFGQGQRTIFCSMHTRTGKTVHSCDIESGHNYQHRCWCGFRWTQVASRTLTLSEFESALTADRRSREEFPLGLLRRKREKVSA